MEHLSGPFIENCKKRLVDSKSEILNRLRYSQNEFYSRERGGGDEGDQSVEILAEHQFLTNQDRLRNLLLDIEVALSRIETGSFGICEETEEPIEADRLLALPWTRLSIEGAEIREAMKKKFAR